MPTLGESCEYKDIDPVVPNDAIGLKILGSCSIGSVVMYKSNIILRGPLLKNAQPCWMKMETLDKRIIEGKISVHHVLLKHIK